jgi:VWFA-related protein
MLFSRALIVPLVAAGLASQQPQFKSGIERVLVDVQVVDRQGQPIENLGPGDFDVRFNRDPRPVASVEFLRAATAATPAGGSTAGSQGFVASHAANGNTPGGRDFVLAIDESSFRPADAVAVVHAAQGFIEHLAGNDRVGLFTYPAMPRFFPLTPDHRQVWRALDTVVGSYDPPSSRFHLSPLEVVDIEAGDVDLVKAIAKRECFPGVFQSECLRSIPADANAIAAQYESVTGQCTDSLRRLFASLAQDPQRKTVVIVSGGMFASDRVGGRPDLTTLVETLGEDAARADANIYVLHIDTTFLNAFSATNAPPATALPRFTSSQSRIRQASAMSVSLERLASTSGGTLIRLESGREDSAFQRILRETSAYYLLTVEPTDADRDGRRHFITVKVKTPGAEVRARASVLIPKQ